MSTMLVVKDGSAQELEIRGMVGQGRYDAAVEADERNSLCVVYAKDEQIHEYLLDLFSDFSPVPIPRNDAGDLRIFYTGASLEKSLELMADDFFPAYL